MKRLNVKLVVGLLIVLVTAVVGGYFAHAFQYGAAAEGSRQEAEALVKKGKRPEAMRKYLEYVKQKGAAVDVETLVDASKLANSLFFEQPSPDSYGTAYGLLRPAMRQFPENAKLRELYAELMMFPLVKHFDEAIDPLIWLTDSKRGKHDPKFDLMLAECYVHRSFLEKAVAICSTMIGYDRTSRTFNSATAQFPNQIDAYDYLARLFRDQVKPAQPEDADRVMNQMVVLNNDSFRAHLLRARYFQQYLAGKGAKEDLAVAMNLKGGKDDPDVILYAAQTAMMDGKFDDCQKLLRHGLDLYPTNVSMYRQWAVLKRNENKFGEAVTEVEKGLKLLPGNPNLLYTLCEIQLRQDLKGAGETLKQLRATNYPKPRIDLMAARILFSKGEWREAAQQFERVRPLFAQSGEPTRQTGLSAAGYIELIDLLAARCYANLGEYDKQLDASRRVLQSDPGSFEAQIGVASALMATGKAEEAKKIYMALAHAVGNDKTMSSPAIWRPIVQLLMDEQMRLPEKKRDWSQIDAIIGLLDKSVAAKGAASDKNSGAPIALLKAEIDLRKNHLEDARKLLVEAQAKNPLEPSIWSALSTVAYRLKGAPAALKILNEAPAQIRDDVVLRLNHIGILLRQGGDHVKELLLALDADSDKLAPPDRARLWYGLGAALLSLGDQEGAERYWIKVTEISPDDLKTRFSLLELARETGDDAIMSKMVAQFRTIMGDSSAEARYAEAARSVALVRNDVRRRTPTGRSAASLDAKQKQTLVAARKLLDEVRRERTNWHEVWRVLGDVEVLENNVDAAITDYQQALKLGPPNPMIIRPLVLLLSRANRTDEAKAMLDLLGEDMIDETKMGPTAAKVDADKGDFSAAIARAKHEVPDDSRDPSGHLWIANIYERAGRTAEAEASFRRAVATGPDQQETWLRLIYHLGKNHKADQIRTVLLDARKQLPEDRVNQVLGPGYELIGDYPQAEGYYKSALEAAPDDPNTHRIVANFYMRIGRTAEARKEALAVLRLSGNDPKNKQHVLWARGTLASLLAASGKYHDFIEAKALLTKNVQDSDGSPDEKIRLADLLGLRVNEPSSWREAVKLLESINKLPPAAQVTLAHFHEVLGNWADARRDMVSFLSEQKAAPAAYAVFVDMLIRHDELADATSWLDRLDAVAPTKPGNGLTEPLILRSRILVRRGRSQEAVNLLKSALPSRPIPPDKIPLLRNVAMQLDKMHLDAAAEDLYREYVGYEPKGKLLLASFIGRTGRLDESLDLCEESLKTHPMTDVMQVAGDVFQSQPSHIEPKHIARVEKWYQRALHDDPESAPLLLNLAEFREISGQFDEAERIYRDLLRRSDLNPIQRSAALNNLAFSLAGRKKDLDDALSYINEAVQLFGQNSDVLDTRGMVYVAMAKYPEALADLSEAVRIPDPSPVKLLHLALAQDLSGDRSAAASTFDRAKQQKLDPTSLRKIERDSYDRLSKNLNP